MAKYVHTSNNGRLTYEVEASTQSELAEKLAAFSEVFEDNVCRKNGEESSDVIWRVREVDGNKYFEKVVMSGPLRGTKKSYGQLKEGGGLFPKVKDKEGNYLPDGGWVKYNSETKKEE